MIRRTFLIALSLALIALGLFAAITVAQGDIPEIPGVVDPTVAMLSGVTGLALVITVIMQLLRSPIPPAIFDKWAPFIAAIIGILFALLGALLGDGPRTGNSILQAVLVGLFAGSYSQNLNMIVARARAPEPAQPAPGG